MNRAALLSLALAALTACATQPPGPGQAPDMLGGPLAPGAWSYKPDEPGGPATVYGEPQTEGVFMIACDRARQTIRLSRAAALDIDAVIDMRIITAAGGARVCGDLCGGRVALHSSADARGRPDGG